MRLLWVIALVGCDYGKKVEPPPPPPPPLAPVPVDATEPVTVDPPPGPKLEWFVEAIASDKKRVLLSELAESRKLHYRVVVVATNAIETDLDLPALSSLPLETLRDDGSQKKVKVELDTPAIAD